MTESSRSKTLEVMAKGYCAAECRGHRVTACNPCRHWDIYSEEAERLFSHLQAEGMAVVPVEPSEEMLAAAFKVEREPKPIIGYRRVGAVYAAMLAASPYGKAVVKEKDDE